MGYSTTFDGHVEVEPPLNPSEIAYLSKFGNTRRMKRGLGPYFIGGSADFGQGRDQDIVEYNSPPDGQPGLWCQWMPTKDGQRIEWDGFEKFYNSAEWMAYLIDYFLRPDAEASRSGDPQFADFTFDHVVNGTIYAQGEDSDDRWKLVVKDNEVSTVEGRIVYEDER